MNSITFRPAQIHLFDTCTHKCQYCHYAESGKVLDQSQLLPYKDPEFIDQVVAFFNKRTSETEKWNLLLTGGEPLLMPNLPRFAEGLKRSGNKVSYYTALLIGETHPNFQYLLKEAAEFTEYLMVSFHPEAEDIEDVFFERLKRLKQAGHAVRMRFIAHPQRLHRIDEIADKCRALDIAMVAYPLFSGSYPEAYTAEERKTIGRHVNALSQVIALNGGIDTRDVMCNAGSKLIAIDMRTGVITPCVTTKEPILGNLYEDKLELLKNKLLCPLAGEACSCEVYFEKGVVEEADDRQVFELQKKGFVEPRPIEELETTLADNGIKFSKNKVNLGLTKTADFGPLEDGFVKAVYKANQEYLHSGYAADNHPTFRSRQFPAGKTT